MAAHSAGVLFSSTLSPVGSNGDFLCNIAPPWLVASKGRTRLNITASKAADGSGQTPRRRSSPQRPRRRRQLRKEDPKSQITEYDVDPFLQRPKRLFKEQGKHTNYDVEQLKMQSDNKFELILEIAAEATDFLVNHPEEAITKKPILKAISDRVNNGFGEGAVADAYLDTTHEFLEDLGMHTLF